MSVVTAADENLESAKEAIDNAIQHLSKIVVEKCWGSRDYKKEYFVLLQNTMFGLISTLAKLENCECNED